MFIVSKSHGQGGWGWKGMESLVEPVHIETRLYPKWGGLSLEGCIAVIFTTTPQCLLCCDILANVQILSHPI